MQAATARPVQVFTAARPGTAACRRRGQLTAARAAAPSQLDGELDPPPSPPSRRQTLASAAARLAAAAGVVAAPEAQAVIKGYEPMPQLEGKDYGKPRMT